MLLEFIFLLGVVIVYVYK